MLPNGGKVEADYRGGGNHYDHIDDVLPGRSDNGDEAALRSGQYHGGHNVSHEQHHHHHQHDHAGHSGHPNSTKSVEDAEEERLKTACCAFEKYMQCSEFTVRHACGDETSFFTRKLLDKMSNTLIRMHCVDYTAESMKCWDYFISSASRTSSVRWSSSSLIYAIVLLMVLFMHT